MKKPSNSIKVFSIAFILFCVTVVAAMPVYTLIQSGSINRAIQGWIEENIRDNRSPVTFYVDISYESEEPDGLNDTDLAGMVSYERKTYRVSFDRERRLMKTELYYTCSVTDGILTQTSYPECPAEEYYLDLSGEVLLIIGITGTEKTIITLDNPDVVLSIKNALLPTNTDIFTDLRKKIGEASFTNGKIDYSNQKTVISTVFTEPLASLYNEKPRSQNVNIHYSINTDRSSKDFSRAYFTLAIKDHQHTYEYGVKDTFEYLYRAFTGKAYKNTYTLMGKEYCMEVRFSFSEDMYKFDPFDMPDISM